MSPSYSGLLPWQLALLLIMADPAQAQRAVTFSAAATYSTGAMSRPQALVVADVNGDGKLDVVTANTDSDTAGVLLGTGTGSFGAVTQFSTGTRSGPVSITVADMNGDGLPDLLTANNNSDSIGILLGTGMGSFGPVTTWSTGTLSQPTSLVVGDVNGDGQADVLTANYNNDTVGILLGTGAGHFEPVTTLKTGSHPQALAVTDVNEDGKPDVLTINQGGDMVGVLLGLGSGRFSEVTTFGPGQGGTPRDIAVADVNGDGHRDVLTVCTITGRAAVLLGTGTGSFGAVTQLLIGDYRVPSGLVVADVNGDGQLDLVTANERADAAGILPGTGAGSFGAMTEFGTGLYSSPLGIVAADVNGDGRPDLLTANYHSSTVGVLLNTTAAQPLALTGPAGATRPAGRAGLALFPNPAQHGAATLTGAMPRQQVQVLDALGRLVATCMADAAGSAALSGLDRGVYLVRAGSGCARLVVE